MIIIITGASHTGKTFFAQKLLEKYNYTPDIAARGLVTYGPNTIE